MTWRLIIAHCPSGCHEHLIRTFTGVAQGSFAAPDHSYPSHLILRLTVNDGDGASDVTDRLIHPRTVTLRIRSNPSGLRVTAAAQSVTTPFDMTAIAGSAIQIGAPSSQVVEGFTYTWDRWSNGGSISQTVRPTASTTYTATFDGGFDDVPPGTRFGSDIAFIFNEGITVGCSDAPALFCPNGLVTRAQMATFLSRALDLRVSLPGLVHR